MRARLPPPAPDGLIVSPTDAKVIFHWRYRDDSHCTIMGPVPLHHYASHVSGPFGSCMKSLETAVSGRHLPVEAPAERNQPES